MRNAIVTAAVVVLSGCVWTHAETGPTEHEHTTIPFQTAALTRVRLVMGAGEIEVRGGATSLAEADFVYNVASWKPDVVFHPSNGENALTITNRTQLSGGGRNTRNEWKIELNDTVPMDVSASLGAGEARLRLGSLDLRNLELSMGAGEADVDLRGNPTSSYRVSVRGGVGEATVRLPAHVAISAAASGGIGSINVKGLEKRNGRWINPRAMSSPVTIDVDVHGGVGEITIAAE